MPLAPESFTADMVRAIPDDGMRYELVWGELLVTPAPVKVHQRIVRRLTVLLDAYCARSGVGETFASPADVSWGSDTLVQPDVFVVPPEEAATPDWASVKHLLLVAEVLSPATARRDRFQKRKLYQAQGVAMLWLVDPVLRVVEVWTPEAELPSTVSDRLTWHPRGAAAPLVIELDALLGDVR